MFRVGRNDDDDVDSKILCMIRDRELGNILICFGYVVFGGLRRHARDAMPVFMIHEVVLPGIRTNACSAWDQWVAEKKQDSRVTRRQPFEHVERRLTWLLGRCGVPSFRWGCIRSNHRVLLHRRHL